ncbi:MAG: hypothetical protein ILA26_07490 [Methanobrevibacter sp.]|uniref:hypothetical protein n=1 Tax=Methanobrevibacter sp. TaxID=66852 RepID=UPI001B4FBF5D|nr:hypothetical protein [Methanobrevibacter sp.]MBP3791856.1 hypothetical protein [Methanobrevibacter sp.]
MPLGKDTTFKVIGKDFLKKFLEIFGFEIEIDYSQIEELTGDLVLLEGEVKKPDAVFSDGKVVLMLEYQSTKLDIDDKKRFKVYVSVWDFQKNKDNKQIIFAVVSTVDESGMVEYSINDWDIFKFPILSLKDLDSKQIIYTIETKIKNQDTFSDRELIELALTPILPTNRKDIINQFFETADLISRISFPNEDIKNSVCGLVLMLTNIYFDELEEVRKKIQGVYMGKIDCVVEFGQERYEEGIIDKSEEIARRLIDDGGFSDEKISELVVLPLERIVELRNSL